MKKTIKLDIKKLFFEANKERIENKINKRIEVGDSAMTLTQVCKEIDELKNKILVSKHLKNKFGNFVHTKIDGIQGNFYFLKIRGVFDEIENIFKIEKPF